jgi:hypothetical protein
MDRKVNDGSPSSRRETINLETSAPIHICQRWHEQGLPGIITTSNDGIAFDIFDFIVWWSSEALLSKFSLHLFVTLQFDRLLYHNTIFLIWGVLLNANPIAGDSGRVGHSIDCRHLKEDMRSRRNRSEKKSNTQKFKGMDGQIYSSPIVAISLERTIRFTRGNDKRFVALQEGCTDDAILCLNGESGVRLIEANEVFHIQSFGELMRGELYNSWWSGMVSYLGRSVNGNTT